MRSECTGDLGRDPGAPRGLRVTSLTQPISGEYRYEYALADLGRQGDLWGDLNINLKHPASQTTLPVRSHQGWFLFDAQIAYPENLTHHHAPVSVTVPEGDGDWMASLTYDGNVSWNTSGDGEDRDTPGLHRGQTQAGFALQSPALPAFREWHATIFRQSSDADTRRGVILAPGWMPGQVTALYLQQQVEGACHLRAISGCPEYRILGSSVAAAEAKRDDRAYQAALRTFAARLAADRGVTESGRLVLRSAADALMRRPPSERAAVLPTYP